MNISRMNKPELIAELEKRSLLTTGLKEELKSRLLEAIEKDSCEITEVNIDDNSEEIEVGTKKLERNDTIESDITNSENDMEANGETINDEDEMIIQDPSTALTVEDAIKMKTSHEIENESMIVNLNEDEIENDSGTNSPNDENVNSIQTNNNREMDNGDHEIIEISEEVVIDDEDNQENDNNNSNYNDLSSDSNHHQVQSRDDVESEMEKTESRKEDVPKDQVKTEIWVSNIAEDVKAVELKELFGKFGKVISAKVVMNAKNPSGSCFGCIQLASATDMKACIANLDQTEFRGNIITITNDISERSLPKVKQVRKVSPASSSESWGDRKKSKDRDPLPNANKNSVSQGAVKNKTEPFDKDKRGSIRDKPNIGYNKSKEYPDRRGGPTNRRGNHNNQYEESRKPNYADRQNTKPYYKPNNYSSSYGAQNDNRGKDSYPQAKREGRDNPKYDSRYGAASRDDRSVGRGGDYGDSRIKSRYDSYASSRPAGHYDNYEDSYDRRDRRSGGGYDRPLAPLSHASHGQPYGSQRDIDSYQHTSAKRDLYKRPRPEETDDYLQPKRRRSDLEPTGLLPSVADRGHYYRAAESPKKSYYPERDIRKPDYRARRDDYAPDYNTKSDRDFFPVPRRSMEYPSSRREGPIGPAYETYSPDRHLARSNHYNSKDSYAQHATDFGGRSRRY